LVGGARRPGGLALRQAPVEGDSPDPSSGVATPVGAAPFAIPLAGASFGFDFNPTVDRIRVVSDAGQNVRQHPDLGTVVDGALAYDATTDDGDPVDGNAGRTPGVVGAACTNRTTPRRPGRSSMAWTRRGTCW
jgi:hypothetical protein